MSWMVRYDKLDDNQKDFVDIEVNKEGNIWIKGFAGSGKSVMLIHAMRKKLESNPNSKICVVVYTHSLIDMFRTGMNELGMPNNIPVMTYFQFKRNSGTYDYIFSDEIQDFPEDVVCLLNQRGQHVYIAGDSNQSIYHDTVEPYKIGNLLNAKPFELTRIYRLTRTIIEAVTNLLPDMEIFSARRDMTKRDVSIRLGKGVDREEEVSYIWEQASNASSEGYSSVILLPTHDDINDFSNRILTQNGIPEWDEQYNNWGKPNYNFLNQYFRNNGLSIEYIGNNYGSLQNADNNKNIILMTYHSAKGLDFENVFLPYLSSGLYIFSKTLLMVAITRSKMNLYITYSGFLHPSIESFESTCCQKIDIGSTAKEIEPVLEFDF